MQLPATISGTVTLQVRDMRGTVVRQQAFASGGATAYWLSLQGLPGGTYLILARTAAQRFTRTLVVE